MKIFRHICEIPAKLTHPVVTIGNFDGVHLGHRKVLHRVLELAQETGGESLVITFAPHPLQVVSPHRRIKLITTAEEKAALIAASRIDYLLQIPFDAEFAATSAQRFVEEVLVDRIGVERLVIGYDYAFGRGREGEVELLRRLGEEFGFSVEILEPVTNGVTVYSSTAVRTAVEEGDVKGVVSLLGRHYAVSGRVVRGFQRGRELGFPTANLETEKELIPAAGVYAVKALVGGDLYDGACNIGFNPTFNNERLSLEVFLFEFDGDLYGEEVTLYFIERLRPEQRFPNPEALKAQIAQDVARCRDVLAGARIVEYYEP